MKGVIKDYILYLLSFCLKYTTVVRKNRIIFSAWHGTKFNCNPKALATYLATKHKGEFELFFLVTEPSEWIEDQRDYPDIHFIKNGTLFSRYLFSTSKFIVANQWINIWNKRKNQVFIQTWHGSGPKKSDKDALDVLSESYIKIAERCCRFCDICISGNAFQTERFHVSYWYDGPVLECGTPRTDLYFQDNSKLKSKICNKYGIGADAKLIIFAPTFRTEKSSVIDFTPSLLIDAFEKISNNKCYLLTRLHPAVPDSDIPEDLDTNIDKKVVNVTRYPDIQDLLAVSDYLITDYSSVSTEFLIQKKPCFLYVPDIHTFERGLYFEPDELPYSVSESFEGLLNSILSFEPKEYTLKTEAFSIRIGLVENGTACESIYKYIIERS